MVPNTLNQTVDKLLSFRLNNLDMGNNYVYPDYTGSTIANLPASVCEWLDIPTTGAPPLSPNITNLNHVPFQHIVILVVDGLGLLWLQKFLENKTPVLDHDKVWAWINERANLSAITSVIPSTTSSALTTIWTAVPPAQHGVIGYEMWLKEYGILANMITHSPAAYTGDSGGLKRANFQPEQFLPVPGFGDHLKQHQVKAFAFLDHTIARSGLSRMHTPQAEIIPFYTISDLWMTLKTHLDKYQDQKTYNYVYWGKLDEIAHRYGVTNERTVVEFAALSQTLIYFLKTLEKSANDNTLFLMTSDHGMIETIPLPEYDIKLHPEFTECLTMMPACENRLPALYLRPEKIEQAKNYINNTWGNRFQIIRSEDAFRSGLFGFVDQPHGRIMDRIGDYILLPRDNHYFWWANKENLLHGRHGSLSPEEMLVPLLSMVF